MKHNKWVKRFEKEFGTQKQWMSTPATTPYARRSQLDFYRGLKHFISSLLKEQRVEILEEVREKVILPINDEVISPTRSSDLTLKETMTYQIKALSILKGKKK